MKPIEIRVQYDAPVERVFEVFANLQDAAAHISAITKLEMLTDGPVGAGTRFRETRKMFGKECTEEMEITAFEPGRSYVVGCDSCGSRMLSTFTFTQVDGRTEVCMSMDTQALKMFSRIMMVVTGPLMRRSMLKCMRADFEDMRRVIEQGEEVVAEPV